MGRTSTRSKEDTTKLREAQQQAVLDGNGVFLCERLDVKMLERLDCTLLENPQDQALIAKLLSLSPADRSVFYGNIVQDADGNFTSVPDVRWYASGPSLQTMPKYLRRLACNGMYHDIDCTNSIFTLLSQICKKHGVDPEVIEEYRQDRDGILNECIEKCRTFTPGSDGPPRGVLKNIFLSLVNGGGRTAISQQLASYPRKWMDVFVPWITKFRKPIRKLFNVLHGTTKVHSTFISDIYFAEELKVLKCMKKAFEDKDFTIGALIHDGLMIAKNGSCDDIPETILVDVENYVKQNTGYRIELVEKHLQPTQEDLDVLLLPMNESKLSPKILLQYRVARLGQSRESMRIGEWAYCPSDIPGVYKATDPMHKVVETALVNIMEYQNMSHKMMDDWWHKIQDRRFPLRHKKELDFSKLSFQNVYLDKETLTWHKYTDNPPISFHYFDVEIDVKNFLSVPTPMWDTLVSYQLGPRTYCSKCNDMPVCAFKSVLYCRFCAEHELSPEDQEGLVHHEVSVADNFELLIGRLFYKVGLYDNWQVVLSMLGPGDTGKSTCILLMKLMFPAGTTGVIDDQFEDPFGLVELYKNLCNFIADGTKKLSSRLSVGTYKSMVTGEGVCVAGKHKDPVNIDWSVPLVQASNEQIYPDIGGSIHRRVVQFGWKKIIKDRITDLSESSKSEIAYIVLRCMFAYRRKCQAMVGKSYWDFVSNQELREQKEERERTGNPVDAFLSNGGGERCRFEYKENAITTIKDFKVCFDNYMLYDLHMDRVKCDKEEMEQCFSKFEYVYDTLNICRKCKLIGSKINCGSHFENGKNRSKTHVIRNMLMTEMDSEGNDVYSRKLQVEMPMVPFKQKKAKISPPFSLVLPKQQEDFPNHFYDEEEQVEEEEEEEKKEEKEDEKEPESDSEKEDEQELEFESEEVEYLEEEPIRLKPSQAQKAKMLEEAAKEAAEAAKEAAEAAKEEERINAIRKRRDTEPVILNGKVLTADWKAKEPVLGQMKRKMPEREERPLIINGRVFTKKPKAT